MLFLVCASLLSSTVAALGPQFGTASYSNHFGRPGVNASFDYVVVGGGTAGLAIANRLAENDTFSVAVIEAGGFYELENGNLTMVPAYYQQNLGHPSIDWDFQTTPQAAAVNQTFTYDRGKTLGGRYCFTTSFDAMTAR